MLEQRKHAAGAYDGLRAQVKAQRAVELSLVSAYPNCLYQPMLDEESLQVSWAAGGVHVACIQHTTAQQSVKRRALEAAR
jgi:hypothetical protein